MARQFDGFTGKVEAADSVSLRSPTTAITMAAWVYYVEDGDDFAAIVQKAFSATDPFISYELSGDRAATGARKQTFAISTGVLGGIQETAPTATDLPFHTWYFVVGRWATGEKMQLRIYNYDGSIRETVESAATVSMTIGYNAQPLKIAAGGNSPEPFLAIRAAGLYIHNEKLTDTEVDTLLALHGGTGTLPRTPSVGYWPLAGTASPEPDVVNGNNGTVTAAPATLLATGPSHRTNTDFLTGFEHGVVSQQGGGLFSTVISAASLSIDTTVPRSGSRCLRLDTPSANTLVRRTIELTNRDRVVTRFGVRIGVFPNVSVCISQTVCANGEGECHIDANGDLRITIGGANDVIVATGLTTNVWYLIETAYDTSGATASYKCRFNGAAAVETTRVQASVGSTICDIGACNTLAPDAAVLFFDDWIVGTYDVGNPDPWYGDGKIEVLVPVGEGTHNGGTNFKNRAGTTATYADLTEIPLETTSLSPSTFVGKTIAGSTANYFEVLFGNRTHTEPIINAVRGIAAHAHSSATGTVAGAQARVYEPSEEEYSQVQPSGVDPGVTLAYYADEMVMEPATGWSDALVNGLLGRFGFNSDVSPNPRWFGFILEVDTKAGVGPKVLAWNYDNVDRTSYTTPILKPTPNRWLVVDIENSKSTVADPVTVTGLSGGSSLTFVQEATKLHMDVGARRVTRVYAWTGATPGAGTILIDAGGLTQTGCLWIVYELPAGVNTSDPFVQTVSATTDTPGTSISVPLAAFASPDNRPLIVAMHTQDEFSMPELGYTEVADWAGSTPSTALAVAYLPDAVDTSPSYSWVTIDEELVAIASEVNLAVGGQTYPRTSEDSVSISDTTTRTLVLPRSLADTVTPSEVATRSLVLPRSSPDSLSVSDAVDRVAILLRAISETVTPAEAVERSQVLARALSDSVSVSEIVDGVFFLDRIGTEAFSTSDEVTRALVLARVLEESLTTSDAVTRSMVMTRQLAELVEISDAAVRSFLLSRDASDLIVVSDVADAISIIGRGGVDSVSITDAANRLLFLPRTGPDAITVTDEGLRLYSGFRSGADGLVIDDAVERFIALQRSSQDSLLFDDVATRVLLLSRLGLDEVIVTDQLIGGRFFDRSANDSVVPIIDEVTYIITEFLKRRFGEEAVPTPTEVATFLIAGYNPSLLINLFILKAYLGEIEPDHGYEVRVGTHSE